MLSDRSTNSEQTEKSHVHWQVLVASSDHIDHMGAISKKNFFYLLYFIMPMVLAYEYFQTYY